MNKKITLLVLAAIGAAVLVLPASAMAVEEDIPLHLVPEPGNPVTIAGGAAQLTTVGGGLSVNVKSVVGSLTFDTSTTGTIQEEFREASTLGGFVACRTPPHTNIITVKALPFHLVTLTEKKPGILITPPAGGVFAEFECAGQQVKLMGNGLIGTITSPACDAASTTLTITFQAERAGVQRHKTVEGTKTVYHLETIMNGTPAEAALEDSGTVTFAASTKLECT